MKAIWIVAGAMGLLVAAGAAVRPQEPPAKPAAPDADGTKPKVHDDELRCGGIWYDSTECACKKGDGADAHACCACEGCTGGPKCPCLAVLNKDTGTVTGTVKSPWFKRIPGVVFVREVRGRKFALPRVHPVMDQKSLVYTPHVLPVMVGSTVDFPNSDEVRHNVFSTKDSPTVFNLGTYEAGLVKTVKFDKLGTVNLLCNVHAEMNAYIVVGATPYFATVDTKTSAFTLRHVPAGTWKLGLFHEKATAEDLEVTVAAGKETKVEFSKLGKK